MPMFDWDLAPGQTVSSDFWVYWAVTLPLTFVVLAIWLLWINRTDVVSFLQKLSDRKEEGGKTTGNV